jgi:ParB family chromosome partitioning protein
MITKKPKGLGRGLEALLGDTTTDFGTEATRVTNATATLPVKALQAGKYQPRTRMDEGPLNELADSIREQGLLQAILVRPISDGKAGVTHEIIAGERRFRAAQRFTLEPQSTVCCKES